MKLRLPTLHCLMVALLLGGAFCVVAQGVTNVTVTGSAVGAAGKTIGLYGYDDMLSRNEVLFEEAIIDGDGRFVLHCYANYPRLVYLQAENYSQAFYVEPGRNYQVYIPQFDWTIDERQNVFLAPVALPVEFLGLGDNELNLRIARFDAVVDSFVSVHRVYFDPKYKPQRRWFDTLRAELSRRGVAPLLPESEGAGFYDRYATYSLAEMQLAMRFTSRGKLIDKYIKDQPVRYYDESYMQLFLVLYAHSVSGGTKRIGLHRLTEWVERGDIATMLDSLGLDPLLRNEQVRELAALEALKECYYDSRYNSAAVVRMVELLGAQSRFAEHKQLAQRLKATLTRGEHGQEVAPFVLPDVDRQPVDVDSLRGKWVYLSFVRVDDPASRAEIETMAFFRDSVYGRYSNVVFVSVSCDREFQKMYHFLKNNRKGHRYNWTWLHFDGNYRLLERYGVVSYPTFILIDPEGRRYYNVTPAPASGILMHGPWEKGRGEK